MSHSIRHAVRTMGTEEKLLNASAFVGALCVFFPWLSGEWLGGATVSFSGFGTFTSFIGFAIFALNVGVLIIGLSPLLGGPHVVRRTLRHPVRLFLALQSTILSIAALSVLTRMTYDYTKMDIRFGIYVTFIASLIATFYAFWLYQEQRRHLAQELFHHPEDDAHVREDTEDLHPHHHHTPPPPPPPPPPEEHHVRP